MVFELCFSASHRANAEAGIWGLLWHVVSSEVIPPSLSFSVRRLRRRHIARRRRRLQESRLKRGTNILLQVQKKKKEARDKSGIEKRQEDKWWSCVFLEDANRKDAPRSTLERKAIFLKSANWGPAQKAIPWKKEEILRFQRKHGS